MTAAGVVFLAIALAHLGRRGGRLSAGAALGRRWCLSVALPIAARGPARQSLLPARPTTAVAEPEASRARANVTMLMFDGATLDMISPAVAAGRLPNIGRIFDQGAVLHLATLRPTQAEPVWSAIATGALPMYNGVRSAEVYRAFGGPPIQLLPDYCFAQALVSFGFLSPSTADDRRPDRAADLEHPERPRRSRRRVGWPLTQPAPQVNGFVVSEAFHRLSETEMAFEGASAVWPPELLAEVRTAIQTPADPDPVALVANMGAPQPVNDYDARRDPTPVVGDRVHLQLLTALEASAPRFLAVRFPGIDAVGHFFLRYADPSAFGDVSEDERAAVWPRAGPVLWLHGHAGGTGDGPPGSGRLAAGGVGVWHGAADPGQARARVDGRQPAHQRHPRARARRLRAGIRPTGSRPGRPPRASVVDLAPTLLYFLGLPVGRDMDGFARIDCFKPSFTSDKPVTYIPTYGR